MVLVSLIIPYFIFGEINGSDLKQGAKIVAAQWACVTDP